MGYSLSTSKLEYTMNIQTDAVDDQLLEMVEGIHSRRRELDKALNKEKSNRGNTQTR